MVPKQLMCMVCVAAELQKQVSELAAVVAAGKAQFDEKAARLEGLKARLKECDKGEVLVPPACPA